MEQHAPRRGFRVARMTVDMLGPVPISPLRAEVRVVRPSHACSTGGDRSGAVPRSCCSAPAERGQPIGSALRIGP
nr:acyl-CoA thioesterase domain-containing protein [Nocardia terpenica]